MTVSDLKALAERLREASKTPNAGKIWTSVERTDALAAAEAIDRLVVVEGERDEAMRSASRLAAWMFDNFYKDNNPPLQLLDVPAGVVTQIDNMLAGIVYDLSAATSRGAVLRGALERIDSLPPNYTGAQALSVVRRIARQALQGAGGGG